MYIYQIITLYHLTILNSVNYTSVKLGGRGPKVLISRYYIKNTVKNRENFYRKMGKIFKLYKKGNLVITK